jgi:hypothetical protein
MASKLFLKLPVTIPVAPVTAGITIHFMFHIYCISIHKLLYFRFFSASFCGIIIIIIIIMIFVIIALSPSLFPSTVPARMSPIRTGT